MSPLGRPRPVFPGGFRHQAAFRDQLSAQMIMSALKDRGSQNIRILKISADWCSALGLAHLPRR